MCHPVQRSPLNFDKDTGSARLFVQSWEGLEGNERYFNTCDVSYVQICPRMDGQLQMDMLLLMQKCLLSLRQNMSTYVLVNL